MLFQATASAITAVALLAGPAIADAQSVLSEASSTVVDAAESATSAAPVLATFTVRGPLHLLFCAMLISLADLNQGRFRRAVHRRLGDQMEAIPRQEG